MANGTVNPKTGNFTHFDAKCMSCGRRWGSHRYSGECPQDDLIGYIHGQYFAEPPKVMAAIQRVAQSHFEVPCAVCGELGGKHAYLGAFCPDKTKGTGEYLKTSFIPDEKSKYRDILKQIEDDDDGIPILKKRDPRTLDTPAWKPPKQVKSWEDIKDISYAYLEFVFEGVAYYAVKVEGIRYFFPVYSVQMKGVPLHAKERLTELEAHVTAAMANGSFVKEQKA